jgi:hypothetical protein
MIDFCKDLTDAKVYRCGAATLDEEYRFETKYCKLSAKNGAIRFELIIASKGGGDTAILLEIGFADQRLILDTLVDLLVENKCRQIVDLVKTQI